VRSAVSSRRVDGRRIRVLGPLAVAAGWVLGIVPAPLSTPPLRAAAPRLQVYFAADFKDAAYQKGVYTKVASAWKRPAAAPKPGGKAVVIAVIQKDGAAPGPTLHLASGSDEWDQSAIAAVTRASPFGPLPKSYTRASVEVHFHFEYD